MENSILKSTKLILGLSPEYQAFDHAIVIDINSAFATLQQIGIGDTPVFSIEDDLQTWDDFDVHGDLIPLVRTYVYLKVRMLFDPPTTSFAIEAAEKQISEQEWRLNVARENLLEEETA